MARKNGKGFGGKVLNFIGLVDDEDPRDTYGDEYESGNYGQRQPYSPRAQRAEAPRRQEMTSRRSNYDPTPRSPRMDRNASRTTGYESRYESARSARGTSSSRRSNSYIERQEDNGRYNYAPRTSSRFAGYEEAPASQSRFDDRGSNLPQTRQPRQGGRQKTVMCNLYSLADCKEVIDQLILNCTVIITMSDLEHGHLQRAVDTLSGAVFALNAKIRKVSEFTYLIAPNSVELDDAMDDSRDY